VKFKEIADIVLKASPAEQTEVVVNYQDASLTRFANNTIHQNVTERNVQIGVRAVIGKRVGIANGNDARQEGLEQLVRTAYDLAKLSPENPEFPGLPSPKPVISINAFDQRTAECSPRDRAERVGVVCRKAHSAGLMGAGSMRTVWSGWGVANSNGVFAECRTSMADITTVIMGENSSGWAQQSANRIDDIDIESIADEAVRKARIGANPVDYQPGEYSVVLDSYATANILAMLALDGMSAMSFQEERSWLYGRIGQQVMAESVTIADDGLDASGLPLPFDFEGMPKKRVAIVDRGVAESPVYDTLTAGRGKVETTGHAMPPSASERYGPLPMNLFLKTGASSVDDMIRSTKTGLYITRFWYTRPVHPRDAVITGMTRDGTYVIRDGEIAYPVKSLRFTQSYVEALKNVELIGSTPRLQWEEFFTFSVPAIKIGQFRFTGSTR